MKTTLKLTSLLSLATAISMFYGCSKTDQVKPAATTDQTTTLNSTADGKHVYGLLPASPEEYNSLPKYSADAFQSKLGVFSTGAPAVYSLATPAVRDQGQIGSCTAFCGSEAYEIGYYYKHGAFPAIVSPAFLYYEERVNILHERITADNGANMVNIDQALTKYGICTEALMPYPGGDRTTAYKTPPTAAAISNALGFKIGSYTLINSGDTAAVKTCLRNNIPVMMGFNVYDNTRTYQYFEALNTTSYTYNPLTSTGALASGVSLLGGHATPIVGYDDTRKAFLVQNSWSASWGNHGFYYMPYTVFMSTKIVPQGGVYYAAVN
ncbi:MAG: C1 family peptidase [Sphingobacteriales bacterium]